MTSLHPFSHICDIMLEICQLSPYALFEYYYYSSIVYTILSLEDNIFSSLSIDIFAWQMNIEDAALWFDV